MEFVLVGKKKIQERSKLWSILQNLEFSSVDFYGVTWDFSLSLHLVTKAGRF